MAQSTALSGRLWVGTTWEGGDPAVEILADEQAHLGAPCGWERRLS